MSVDRIAKLLQMAERAKTPEESAAFFAKAQALATVHQITLAQARQRLPSGAREQPVQKLLTVGRPRQQANRHYLRLLVALARTNGCEIGLYNNNTGALIFGLPSDLATVERMFAVIAPQMIRMGEAFLADGRWRGELVVDLRTREVRPATRQSARASFYQGFTDTLTQRVRAAAAEAKRQAEAKAAHFQDDEPPGDFVAPGPTGVELALRSKQTDVEALARQHIGGGTWRGGRAPGAVSVSAYQAGDKAGARVRLGGQGEIGGASKAVGA